MNYVKITPSKLQGEVTIPPSKSLSHRAIIAAGFSKGKSVVENVMFSEDIVTTCNAMEALGVKIDKVKEADNIYTLKIEGNSDLKLLKREIDCSESGSSLRFFIPICLAEKNDVVFTGRGKLVSRPLDQYYKIFDKQGIEYSNNNGMLPLNVHGKISPGEFTIDGDVSSQFITGLMFTLPLLEGDSKIIINKTLESKGYLDLTMDILEKASIEIVNRDYKEFLIKGNQQYNSKDYRVEGDFSQAAFWLVAGVIGGKIDCLDLNSSSRQGDKEVIDIIKRMEGSLINGSSSIVAKTSNTKATVIDASQCPDIIPVLAVLAAVSEGTTEIINAGRLRIKESDRLTAITTELNKLGADLEEKEEGLIIRGKKELTGGEVESWNDHRIAMALAVASIRCTDEVTIKDSGCVKKSYPTFWEDFKKLGGNVHEWSVG
ncbi:3-phosphoshikimate 1-carboxyvinyltransferase [Clostridium pasteurianum DSM 525 = ATCC 6013]|uniref:3-phosphoshikimate 1-carboxyvinyltransferase n=1 Tax=Clostridium pasteurianum DSM 525 = ATCC 6013 TaxID=1262449 RepID=A0A0H3JAV0_CLOPA|nr:3-phosphoshikimate 1-carboxyvinyltransferase [Clostridium pasteurianum]AJA49868.1 3-phosphoshikimate 1-carboxyvinyltransferase [Clostridium pasteurianum DSM 525 = ATCC 6013]AJA53856.1 3-phosphoshikimate 1-carboxyvinyltransferase [Clostridium pasteurianum DSM 525 = ATCC 6013]AOZ77011.1 3-phosphoshikimate 1-carboxyvinyltransferase [Clostridium pasteurianum DSM 525 = ATCC 6013]AOZ80808.1 3-phosphoshikimate 1-carboxyvinyltransferase [Clostridium pasteurianum]ELP57828.1 3-phosphoshikimate 1-carb